MLEIAIGTGLNLPFYPANIELTGVEISPAMLEIARRGAQSIGHEVELVVGDAQSLPFADQRFDTVVCIIALCSIPDERQAVAEAWRVLRPGGRFVALKHVRSPNFIIRGIVRMLESYTVRTQADHLLREPVETVQSVGFSIEYLKRLKLGIVERLMNRRCARYISAYEWGIGPLISIIFPMSLTINPITFHPVLYSLVEQLKQCSMEFVRG